MDRDQTLNIFREFAFDLDGREPPDESRRAQFHIGWREAVEGQDYTPKTLSRLTWNNAGYRFGKALGQQSRDDVDHVFDILVPVLHFSGGNLV